MLNDTFLLFKTGNCVLLCKCTNKQKELQYYSFEISHGMGLVIKYCSCIIFTFHCQIFCAARLLRRPRR
jgi:hypothetical protein